MRGLVAQLEKSLRLRRVCDAAWIVGSSPTMTRGGGSLRIARYHKGELSKIAPVAVYAEKNWHPEQTTPFFASPRRRTRLCWLKLV